MPKKLSPVTSYARRVRRGEIVAGRWLRLACKRHLDDLRASKGQAFPYKFDDQLAQRAIDFFPLLQHTKGPYAGHPFHLLDYQKFIVGSLFGWVHKKTNLRRFRIAYVEMAKKNGKTTLAAVLAILLAFFDGEQGADVYSAATARKQAKLVWEQSRDMIRRAAWMTEEGIEIYGGKFGPVNISQESTGSKFEPLASDYGRTDGVMPHGAVIDELHEHKNRGMWDIITKGKITRSQPLIFAITTAGFDKETICGEQHDYSEKVLENVFTDDTWFAFIATPDEEDDWKSKKAWRKANPSIGATFSEEDFEKDEFLPAKSDPTKENSFKRYNLNIWTEQATRYLPMDDWDLCRKPRPLSELEGKICFAGLDLARTTDITAFELVFPDGSDLDVLSFFWIPGDDLTLRSNRDRVPYSHWVEQKYITAIEGAVTNYEFVENAILDLCKRFQVLQIGYDPWQAEDLRQRLEREGATMIELRQGVKTMGSAREELKRLTMKHSLRHGANKVLRWMASNVDAKLDPNGNVIFQKSHRTKRIDGIVALTMGIRQAMLWMEERSEGFIYDNEEARPNGFIGFG